MRCEPALKTINYILKLPCSTTCLPKTIYCMSFKQSMMKPLDNVEIGSNWIKLLTALGLATALYRCGNSSAPPQMQQQVMALPVVPVTTTSGTTFREFPAALEGKVNVEIRPQVEGYLEKIYVDEGAYVKNGQPLFKIDARVYNEALNN